MKTPQILIISNKSDITTDFVVKHLADSGVPFYRFNTEELTTSVSITLDYESQSFTLYDSILDSSYSLLDFKAVYYRRPELPNFSGEDISASDCRYMQTEVAYTLEGIYTLLHDAFWISPVWAIRKAENKLMQLQIAKQLGFSIPSSIVSNEPQRVTDFLHQQKNDCIIKPIHTGHISDHHQPRVVFTNLLDFMPSEEQIKASPNYLQKQIHKKKDIRVTVVGDAVFAAAITSQETPETSVDWRKGEQMLHHEAINLPDEISERCIALVLRLGLQYGAIDLILDTDDRYTFLEINPNGQWAWIENLTHLPISKEIANLLISHTK